MIQRLNTIFHVVSLQLDEFQDFHLIQLKKFSPDTVLNCPKQRRIQLWNAVCPAQALFLQLFSSFWRHLKLFDGMCTFSVRFNLYSSFKCTLCFLWTCFRLLSKIAFYYQLSFCKSEDTSKISFSFRIWCNDNVCVSRLSNLNMV